MLITCAHAVLLSACAGDADDAAWNDHLVRVDAGLDGTGLAEADLSRCFLHAARCARAAAAAPLARQQVAARKLSPRDLGFPGCAMAPHGSPIHLGGLQPRLLHYGGHLCSC